MPNGHFPPFPEIAHDDPHAERWRWLFAANRALYDLLEAHATRLAAVERWQQAADKAAALEAERRAERERLAAAEAARRSRAWKRVATAYHVVKEAMSSPPVLLLAAAAGGWLSGRL